MTVKVSKMVNNNHITQRIRLKSVETHLYMFKSRLNGIHIENL